ncbi:MarR family winged helix-turn-helix transcriptional regulator [Miniphocaeibacter halophilus]|uniref:MarR family transcriptional regulator n=1 Tax=Miniphocaeibacter halophilus TaxID=2931922 RepID=A0AC61MRF0_9FIRM|nr:MarR family transcriptional regulator [Miniphocaeibacter halophilus]QQK08139.1 MarR family transcriptional regulator [Miniphocaeibacter halophilus]
MIEELFSEVYEKFKLNFYKNIFKNFETREATLSATETFCVEVINALGRPTISELTNFLEISQPNTAYKVASLVKKGYVRKVQSKEDKREFYLELTDRFQNYQKIKNEYIHTVIDRMEAELSKEDLEKFEEILARISNEFMPEVTTFMLENTNS